MAFEGFISGVAPPRSACKEGRRQAIHGQRCHGRNMLIPASVFSLSVLLSLVLLLPSIFLSLFLFSFTISFSFSIPSFPHSLLFFSFSSAVPLSLFVIISLLYSFSHTLLFLSFSISLCLFISLSVAVSPFNLYVSIFIFLSSFALSFSSFSSCTEYSATLNSSVFVSVPLSFSFLLPFPVTLLFLSYSFSPFLSPLFSSLLNAFFFNSFLSYPFAFFSFYIDTP
jgi:hypothetical protein